MEAPSQDIKDILEESASGFAWVFGTDLFIGKLPSAPNECVVIYDSPGLMSNTWYLDEFPGIQILVRGNPGEYFNAYSNLLDIQQYLNGITNKTVNGSRYILMRHLSGPLFLEWDPSNRPVFTANFELERTSST